MNRTSSTRLGPAIDSPLLRIDALADRRLLQLDVERRSSVLRIHPYGLGTSSAWTDATLQQQYLTVLDWLCLQASPSAEAYLEAAYQFMLQDRIQESLAAFARVDRTKLAAQLQYDYFHAWLARARATLRPARRS